MPPPPWYSYLTLDLLAKIVNNALLHPYICLLIPLCLRACAKPYDSLEMLASFIWAGLVITFTVLGALNRRLGYGPPRELDWEEEVVVITGGRSGLGRCLAEMYGMRGASVAVLDLAGKGEGEGEVLSEGNEALAGVRFYACDVSKVEDVVRARAKIEEELGPPTILINNAATTPHHTPLHRLDSAQYTRTLNVNLHGPFNTLSTFLPALLAQPGATVVTIASVLGKLGAANLTDYTASKAGLIAMHRSLAAELRQHPDHSNPEKANINTILVTPGQLSTALFQNMKLPWYAHFLGPVVEPVELVREIVGMVDRGESGEISLPLYARWIEWVFVLPVGLQRVVRWVAGIDGAVGGGPIEIRAEERKHQ